MTNTPLATLLQAECALLEAFITVLQREQHLLIEGRTEDLEAVAREKSRIADQLTGAGQQREAALSSLGLDAGREGISIWQARADATEQARWSSLLESAAEARRLNETNGRLITERLQRNQQLLQVLTAASNRAALYGPDGQTQVSTGGRTLGSA
ncbi:MAG: flagellar protein FlgN [Proteobacteria bacterium]|nr:flagellar protein FlgN [Pseudomonadota bacterium]HQR05108.1 flagellar protein FlgN [Rhodocyclaceae bacterium]